MYLYSKRGIFVMQNRLNKFIPDFIKKRLTNRPVLQKILKNVGWLTFDRFFQLVVSVLIGVWVARYLGPSDFGLMNFAIAFGSLLGPFVGLGVTSILVRELVTNPKNKSALIGTAFWIQFVTGIIAMIVMNIAILILRPSDLMSFLVVFVFSLGYIFSVFDILSCWFDSKVESKNVVFARNGGIILSSILKVGFILLGFPLIYFVIASLLDAIFRAIFLLYFYFKDKESIFSWKFDFTLAKTLFASSWPLIFSGTMIVIYMKIDQVMLGFLLGDAQVGLYSVSVKLTEIFYFLPGAIMISLFPSLITSKKISKEVYHSRLQKLFDFMTWVPFVIILPIFVLSSFLVFFLYGPEYVLAGPALAISIWALFAVFVKEAVSNYLINENLTKIVFVTAFLGAVSNVVLNLILIPLYGINGAALATVISYLLAAYLGLVFFKETRPIFLMLLKSFNIFRLLKLVKK